MHAAVFGLAGDGPEQKRGELFAADLAARGRGKRRRKCPLDVRLVERLGLGDRIAQKQPALWVQCEMGLKQRRRLLLRVDAMRKLETTFATVKTRQLACAVADD